MIGGINAANAEVGSTFYVPRVMGSSGSIESRLSGHGRSQDEVEEWYTKPYATGKPYSYQVAVVSIDNMSTLIRNLKTVFAP